MRYGAGRAGRCGVAGGAARADRPGAADRAVGVVGVLARTVVPRACLGVPDRDARGYGAFALVALVGVTVWRGVRILTSRIRAGRARWAR